MVRGCDRVLGSLRWLSLKDGKAKRLQSALRGLLKEPPVGKRNRDDAWMVWLLLLVPVVLWAGLRAHDYLEGETLLRDLLDEVWLARADIRKLDASCAGNPNRSDIVVSMTTIPSRLPMIGDTLKSLLRQTKAPAEIRLNLPRYSKREKSAYAILPWLPRLHSVRVVECDDLGPATKLIPTLLASPPDRKIVVVDDDRVYSERFIEDLDNAATRDPDAAFGITGWVVPPDLIDRPTTIVSNVFQLPPAPIGGVRLRNRCAVDILQGFSGYLVRPRFFDAKQLIDYSAAPPAAFFVDDVWISAHCKAPKYVIPVQRANFQPQRHALRYKRTSLGRLNRGGGDVEKRNNTIMIKHFASLWRVGGRAARKDASNG